MSERVRDLAQRLLYAELFSAPCPRTVKHLQTLTKELRPLLGEAPPRVVRANEVVAEMVRFAFPLEDAREVGIRMTSRRAWPLAAVHVATLVEHALVTIPAPVAVERVETMNAWQRKMMEAK